MKCLTGFFALIISFSSFSQEDSLLSALNYYEIYKDPSMSDTALVNEISRQARQIIYVDAQKSHIYARAVYDLSKKINYKDGIASGLYQIADAKMHSGQLDSGIDFADKCIAYSTKNNLQEGLMKGHISKGNGYYYKGKNDASVNEYFLAVEIAEKGFETELAGCYGAIGNSFRAAGNMEKSEEYLLKGYQLAKVYKDTTDLVFLLNNLGIVTKNKNEDEKALEYYNEGLELAILSGNIRREGEFVYNMANVQFRLGNKEEGFNLLSRSAEITAIQGNKRDLAIEHYNIGYWHEKFGNYKLAIEHSHLALEYAEESNFLDVLEASCEVLSDAYGKTAQYKPAYKYAGLTKMYHDSVQKLTDENAMLDLENQYELEKITYQDSLDAVKKELERDHEKKLNMEKVQAKDNMLYAAAGIIALVIIGLVLLFRSNKKVKEVNLQVTKNNTVITQQKEEIEEVHKEITDSINYAQRIQNAVISNNEEWDKISLNHSIFFRPKDVVSGDFYWAHHFDEEGIAIWVAADCTGHGVPGAFMSMLGIGFLNEIIIENKNRDGGLILDQLRAKIIKALAQKGSNTQQKDGMDLALCIWNKKTNELQFTGANNPLWIIRETESLQLEEFDKHLSHPSNGYSLIELKPNKMPVGLQAVTQKNFEAISFQLMPDDILISFTDGYADQFGGSRGKKLKYKPFKELLLDLRTTPVKLHSGILEEKFDKWKGSLEQIDDVCVISVQV